MVMISDVDRVSQHSKKLPIRSRVCMKRNSKFAKSIKASTSKWWLSICRKNLEKYPRSCFRNAVLRNYKTKFFSSVFLTLFLRTRACWRVKCVKCSPFAVPISLFLAIAKKHFLKYFGLIRMDYKRQMWFICLRVNRTLESPVPAGLISTNNNCISC